MENTEEELRQRLREACNSFIGERITPEAMQKIKNKCVAIAHQHLDSLDIKCLAVDCWDAGGGQIGIRVYDPDLYL